MRISDWSSDVCSSDLAAYQALPGQRRDPIFDRAAAPYIAGQVFATAFAVASLIDSVPLGQASTILYFAAAVATYLTLGVGVRDEAWKRRLAAWLPASMSMAWLLAATIVVIGGFLQNDLEATPPFADAEAWAARSEEHTSELQSPMRTSYAISFL